MIRLLTVFILLSLLAFAGVARADDAKTGPDFDKHKQKILQDLDDRISALNAFKSCVSGAKDHAAMKACHEEQEKKEKEFRDKAKARHAQDIDDRIKQLQDEKSKMNKDGGGH